MREATPHDVVQEALDHLKRREIALTAELDMYETSIRRLQSRIAELAVRADRVGVEDRRAKERELKGIEDRLQAIVDELGRCQAAYEALVAAEKHSKDVSWRPGPSAALAEGFAQLRRALEQAVDAGMPRSGAFPTAGAALYEHRKAVLKVLDSWGFSGGAPRRSIRP